MIDFLRFLLYNMMKVYGIFCAACPQTGIGRDSAETPISQQMEVLNMETKVAVLSVIVANRDTVDELNNLLHDYGDHIIGRMGLPYRAKGINLISLAMDAPEEVIHELADRIAKLPDVSVKAVSCNLN